MPVTDFPNPGDDRSVSLDNSDYPAFPVGYAKDLMENWPDIWDAGGNVLGNKQFDLLAPMASENRGPDSDQEEEAVRLREAWAARHFRDFQLPGVVAQMKWLVIGSRGLDHMKQVIQEAKDQVNQKTLNEALDQGQSAIDGIICQKADGASFIISTDAIDRQGEVVDQDGWDFSNWMSNPVILDSHKYETIDDIIGKGIGKPYRVQNGWAIDIQFADTSRGQLAKRLVDSGMLKTVSVGFRSLQRKPDGGVMRHVKQELLEVSLVAIPANPQAIRIKGAEMKPEDQMEGMKPEDQPQKVTKDVEMLRKLRDLLVDAVAQAEAIIQYYDEAEGEESPEVPSGGAEPAPVVEDGAKKVPSVNALQHLLAAFKP